jgi:hypothetical protein
VGREGPRQEDGPKPPRTPPPPTQNGRRNRPPEREDEGQRRRGEGFGTRGKRRSRAAAEGEGSLWSRVHLGPGEKRHELNKVLTLELDHIAYGNPVLDDLALAGVVCRSDPMVMNDVVTKTP